MDFRHIAIAFMLAGYASVRAQPAWPKQQIEDLQRQSEMRRMFSGFQGDPKGDRPELPSFVTIFTKAKTYQGLGHFRVQEGSVLKGTKECAYIRLDGVNIFPEATDSIEFLGETGLKGESGWLFRTLRGKITVYAPVPGGKSTHVSYDDGPIREIKDGEIDKALKSTPIAWVFLNRDRDYAIRLFNRYHAEDVYDPGAGLSLTQLRQSLFYDLSNWSQEKVKSTDGLIVKLAKVRRACQNRNYDGLGPLGDLEGKFPDLYLPYLVEGECYEKQGNKQAAIDAYLQARTYAPEDANLVAKLSEGISRLRWESQGK